MCPKKQKKLIETMSELVNMGISAFVRYLIIKEHRRLITDIRDGIPIEADTEANRQRIIDPIMRSVI
jgi:hypothetical protein